MKMITTRMTANTINTMTHTQASLPLHVRSLTIATRVRLHPEFIKDPITFARQHGVDLVDEVFPVTSFKKDPATREKIEKVKANIHLVRDKAIRLFTERDGGGDWIQQIEVTLALLHGDKDHPLTEPDLVLALSMLKAKVAPLLADRLDTCHIVPGGAGDEHLAYFRTIDIEARLPDIRLPYLHGVSHPNTGPAEGANEKEVKLGHFGDDFIIRFTKSKWEAAGPGGEQSVQGLRVTLSLRGHALLASFCGPDTQAMVKGTKRVVRICAPAVALVYQKTMLRLEGTYLPVPLEWADLGKDVTAAKIIALLSRVTSFSLDELRAMYDQQLNPSKSSRMRLTKDIKAAVDCLKSVPVSSLFRPEVYGCGLTGWAFPLYAPNDPNAASLLG